MPPLSFIPNWQQTALTASNTALGGMYRGARQGALDDMSRFNGTMGGAQSGLLGGLSRMYAEKGAQASKDIGVKAGDWMFQGGQNDLNRSQEMNMFNQKMAFDDRWARMSLEQRQKELSDMQSNSQQNGWMGLLGTGLGMFGGPILGAAGGAIGQGFGNMFSGKSWGGHSGNGTGYYGGPYAPLP